MPYTLPWSGLTVPGSTTPSADIDVKLTNIPDALKERLEDVLVDDVTDDPWVLKNTAGGPVTGKRLLIPGTMFRERQGGGSDPSLNDIFIGAFGDAQVMQAPVMLPPGVTVTLVEFLMRVSSGNVLWEFYNHQFTTPTVTKVVLESGSQAGSGVNAVVIGTAAPVAHVIAPDRFYHVSLDTATSGGGILLEIYGCRITYNVPSSKETY